MTIQHCILEKLLLLFCFCSACLESFDSRIEIDVSVHYASIRLIGVHGIIVG